MRNYNGYGLREVDLEIMSSALRLRKNTLKKRLNALERRFKMPREENPVGAVVSPRLNHYPAGIVGNRKYLQAIRDAIEEALNYGLGETEVFMADGEGHSVIVKLEDREDQIPVCYAHYELTGKENVGERAVDDYMFSPEEWTKAHSSLERLEDFYYSRIRLSNNFLELVRYLFLEKCAELREEKIKTCLNLFHRFHSLFMKLFYDKEGFYRLPRFSEIAEFEKKLKRVGFPSFCRRVLFYGSEEEVRACVDVSLELTKMGITKGLEAVGFVDGETFKNTPKINLPKDKKFFAFLVRDVSLLEELSRKYPTVDRTVLVPIRGFKEEKRC